MSNGIDTKREQLMDQLVNATTPREVFMVKEKIKALDSVK